MSTQEQTWSEFRRTRSLKLRNQIADQNDRLVFDVARRAALQCPEPVEDLEQIGRIGLIAAVERFNPDKGIAFSSFAIPYIRGEILHHLRDHFGSLKIPRRSFEDVGKVKKAQHKIEKAGRVIEADEVAAAFQISKERWQWVSEAVQRKQMATLDEIFEPADESEQDNERTQLHKRVLLALAKLSQIERRCVVEHFFSERSNEAIARQERKTTAQIQIILNTAINKLKLELEQSYAHLN